MAQDEKSKSAFSDYFVSDGLHSIKCRFSADCREAFDRAYPSSIFIFNIVKMLIGVQNYYVELRCPNNNMNSGGTMNNTSCSGKISPLNLF